MRTPLLVAATLAAFAVARGASAQDPHAHAAGDASPASAAPAGPGTYATIADVVRRLDADPHTDWSRVNVAALREHLVDMELVTNESAARLRPVAGGFVAAVTGSGRTTAAIRRMVASHARALTADPMLGVAASSREIDGGVELTVTARDTADARAVARLRGLGFYGVLTLGSHHDPHHMALARGGSMEHDHQH